MVPDPTSAGVVSHSDSTPSAVIGNWRATSRLPTLIRWRRLSLSKGLWYQRWSTDSVYLSASSQTTLIEQGSWNWLYGDSSRLILTPTYRQTGALVAANLPDTVRYNWMADSVRWISRRDSVDTVYWHPG